MRRTIAFVALWFVAGAVAATVAWLGVSVVSDQLSGDGSHPDPLSAEEIRAEVAAGPTTTTVGATDPSTSTTTTVPPLTSTTTTTRPSPGSTPAPPTTSTTSPAPSTVARSYDLVGGDVTLRFSPGGVTVVVAVPAPGFTVDIGESHDGGARVEFESDDHRSRLDGWWDDGPQDEVREDAD